VCDGPEADVATTQQTSSHRPSHAPPHSLVANAYRVPARPEAELCLEPVHMRVLTPQPMRTAVIAKDPRRTSCGVT